MFNILIILAFISGFITYRLGLKDGQKIASGGKIGNIIHKKVTATEEEQRINRGMENILNYANRRRGDLNE